LPKINEPSKEDRDGKKMEKKEEEPSTKLTEILKENGNDIQTDKKKGEMHDHSRKDQLERHNKSKWVSSTSGKEEGKLEEVNQTNQMNKTSGKKAEKVPNGEEEVLEKTLKHNKPSKKGNSGEQAQKKQSK